MALELIAGSLFSVLYDRVSRAVDRRSAYRDLLSRMKRTLESLTGQARFIQEIRDFNDELSLPNLAIDDLETQMTEGANLLAKMSSSDVYNYCCVCGSEDQLHELNMSLERLLDNLQLQQARDVKEILKLERQNRDDFDEMKGMLNMILQQINDPEMKGLVNKLLEQTSTTSGDSSASTSSASGSNTENEGNTQSQVASLETQVEAMLKVLTHVVIEVKDKTLLLRPILGHLKSTLDCLKPLLKDIVECNNKVLDILPTELEDFGDQVKNGMELFHKFSVLDCWSSSEKHKFTNQLFELDEFLQRQLSLWIGQVARNVKETSIFLRNARDVVKKIKSSDVPNNKLELDPVEERIEGSGVAKNELELDVAEERIEGGGVTKNELELDVAEVQETSDVRETHLDEESCLVDEDCKVLEPSSSSLEVSGHKTKKIGYSKPKFLKDVSSKIYKRAFLGPSKDALAAGKQEGLLWYKDIGQHMNGEFSMAAVQASNLMEDQCQLESGPLSLMESGLYGTFIGVYDGHCGPEASGYINDNLFQHLKSFTSKQQSMSVDVIRRAYQATEEGFLSIVTKQWSKNPQIAAIGSCCLTGVICGGTLYIANVGNSRAVLGRVVKATENVHAIQLSGEHNPAIESVRQEMHFLHPDDPQIVVLKHNVWRVKGLINISRSIGDAFLKKPELNRLILSQHPLAHGPFRQCEHLQRPILSAEPTISVCQLQPDDLFLIFASDGLWEHLSNQEAVDIVKTHPHSGSARRLVKTALVEAAKKREMKYSDLKKIGAGIRSHFHDDITVIVVFLDSNLISTAGSIEGPILSVRGGGVKADPHTKPLHAWD